jgi:hypothetical protein
MAGSSEYASIVTDRRQILSRGLFSQNFLEAKSDQRGQGTDLAFEMTNNAFSLDYAGALSITAHKDAKPARSFKAVSH